MWWTKLFFLSYCLCIISIANAVSKLEEKENGTTTTENSQELKTEVGEDRKSHVRKYRRPHIERVWVMRPFANNVTNGNNRSFSDSISSFASAIRDPETFVRYLRHEERQELAKYARQNLTFFNKTLPNSNFVQMEIFSESQSENKLPILNVIVEQDEYDKLDSTAFMDLVKEVASIPFALNSSSEGDDGPPQQQRFRGQQLQIAESITSQNSQQLNQQYQEKHDNISHRRTDSTSEKNQRDLVVQNSSEAQQNGREQSRRKIRKRQRERQFRQKLSTTEPLIVLGEFGQRTRNYTRPYSLEFNRSKSHDILMAPSVYLLPPAESNFRHFNLPQNVQSFTQTPIPVPREKNSLRRRRKRPRPSHPRTSVNELATEVPRISTDSTRGYSDISILTSDIPTDTHHPSTELSSPESVSQIHVEVPPVYSSTSRASISTTAASELFSARQPSLNLDIPPSETSSYSNIPEFDHGSSSNERESNSPKSLRNSATASSLSYDTSSRLDFGYIGSGEIQPPSTALSPPVLQNWNEDQVLYSIERSIQLPYSQEQESQGDFLITPPPNLNNFPNEGFPQSSVRNNAVTQKQPSVSRTKSQQSNFDSLPQHIKNNYSSLMAVIEDMFGDKNSGFRTNENYSNERRQQQNQPRRKSKSQSSREDEYDELQLTAAETAYFRRRQLTQRPFTVLEDTEEIGSIPGVPGRDYPIYNRPPKTNFACVRGQGGYFVDISTRCQVFFVCSDDGRGEPMMCPNGTLFNQDFLVCDWWYNVACEGAS